MAIQSRLKAEECLFAPLPDAQKFEPFAASSGRRNRPSSGQAISLGRRLGGHLEGFALVVELEPGKRSR
jgi:hypothetical protein